MNAGSVRQVNSTGRRLRRHEEMDGGSRKRGIRGNGGFTLVELIVVLVVLGILCSLAVMSIIGWQDYADFKQNNEAAKSIFAASQTQLTQYGERGQLTDLISLIAYDEKDTGSYLLRDKELKNEDGTIALGDIWQSFTGKEERNVGNIYYLMVNKGDYQAYLAKKSLSLQELKSSKYTDRDRKIRAAFDLIDPYVADKSMLDAAICIEFDPDPKVALVYSVFYNDKVESFTYEETPSSSKEASIYSRREKDRREKKTGYYGAETMAKGTDTFMSKPIITEFRLNNKETLNLSWKVLNGENRSVDATALTSLLYKITLYDMSDGADQAGKPVAEIHLGSADKKIETGLEACTVYLVTGKDAAGNYVYQKEEDPYLFPVRYDISEETLTIVLDGLDLSADETTTAEELKHTASIRRLLNLPSEAVNATIVGRKPGVYDTTTSRRSNTEHPYLASREVKEDGVVVYAVDNMRHFNNIRYMEADPKGGAEGAIPTREYHLMRGMNWKRALLSGSVYENQTELHPSEEQLGDYFFKPFLRLGRLSTLMSADEHKAQVIGGLSLDIGHMQQITAETDGIPVGTIGLFVVNQGTIRNLAFSNLNVNGIPKDKENFEKAAAAGGICGQNEGILENLTILSEDDGSVIGGLSSVSGVMNVGGFTGTAFNSKADAAYQKLVNHASVSGQVDVGGIVGSLNVGEHNIVLEDCVNYGKITGEKLREDVDGAYFLGGIAGSTGYRAGYDQANAGKISIRTCKSSPYYTPEEIEEIISKIKNPDTAKDALVGDYVGGIVGYNDGAEIEACSTIRENISKPGYVVGRTYIGGIVGYNSGATGLNIGTDNRNQAYVIGDSYVGGIVGCNAIGRVVSDVKDGVTSYRLVMYPKDTVGEMTAHIKGWINEGIISATGDYAGGITGYNGDTGRIENSYSNVIYNGSYQNASEVSSNARFAGGIAGYNGGEITNKDEAGQTGATAISVVSVVHGKDYVGGVVGFNDIGGTIENYALQGGYISGKRFVGGFVGLNLERSIFESHILSNPNEITGDYFVGGIIGGNLIPVEDDEDTVLHADFRTDNFLGTLSAENGAFAGGFIGYNYLLKKGTGADTLTGERILTEVDAMIHPASEDDGIFTALPAITEDGGERDVTVQMAPIEEAVEQLLDGYANEKASLIIRSEQTSTVQEKLGGVTGRVYVGGVIGYNQRTTKIQIRNVENVSPVEATGYIVRAEGLDPEEKNYSYAGGIIGKVEENVLLYACRNKDIGTVRTKGTYTGGLAELNYGTLQECITGSIGDNTMDYVGGLVGVNAARKTQEGGNGTADLVQGKLLDCMVSGQITGRSYVGGLTAENYGIIRYGEEPTDMPVLSSDERLVEASGTYAGGLAGYAHKTGSIEVKKNAPLCIDVRGTASAVGGIAGANAGKITGYGGDRAADMVQNATGSQDDNRDEEGTSIIGHSHVGGFVGVQMKPDQEVAMRYFENRAHVRATTGYAGGIIAIVAYSEDFGAEGEDGDLTDGTVARAGTSGSAAVVTLSDCENYGLVEVLSEEEDDEQDLELDTGVIEALQDYAVAAGGITAVNFGRIDTCKNYGEVRANSGYMGGIAAINFNMIRYSEVGTPVAADSREDTLELSGSDAVGGIAAVNEHGGVIRDSVVRNLILRNQTESRSSDMGGIVGRNGIDDPEGKENLAKIENCFVGIASEISEIRNPENADYSVWRSEAANYVSKRYAAGQHTFQTEESGTVGNSVVLISNAPDVNMGGVAGFNEGEIHGKHRNDYQTVAAADLKFFGDSLTYFGNLGGIVGYNAGTVKNYEFSGFVSGSSNDPSDTPSYNTGYDLEQSGSRVYGYGGIAGRNGSDRLESNRDVSIGSCFLGMAKIQGTGDTSNRTNVGGVAGFNGKGAVISDIRFSHASKDEPGALGIDKAFAYVENGQTYTGTVWVNATVCGHIGGVAGYNHGSISRINWSSAYEQNRQEKWVTEDGKRVYRGYFEGGSYNRDRMLAEVDRTGALVTAAAGHIGGIVGYNRRTGSISHAATGRNWLVFANRQEQDNGAGGIMGYNISEQDLVLCDNHATVVKRAGNSNAVGGMVGRNENGTTSSWRFYDCHNYGNITGAARVGGMIGNLKYRGGLLEACLNFGEIKSIDTKDAYAGGLIGMFYGFSSGETVNLVSCENHGKISVDHGSAAGGFIGYLRPDAAIKLNLYDGVNTGTIDGTGPTGGFIGDGQKNNTTIVMQNCRNYGYGSDRSSGFKGFIALAQDENVTTKNSFGVTDIRKVPNPISSNIKTNKGGFYFSDVNDEAKPKFWVSRMQALGTDIKNGNLLYNIVSDTNASNAYFQSGTAGTLTFEFSRPVYAAEIELKWFVDSGARAYTYGIEYQEDGNSGWTFMGNVTDKNYIHNFPESTAIRGIRLNNIIAKKGNANANAALEKLEVKGRLNPEGDLIPYTKRPGSDSSYLSTSNSKEATYRWNGPLDTGHQGSALVINHTAGGTVAENEDGQIKVPIGNYTIEDIQNEDRYKDSRESWKLCKGTEEREGVDGYLKIGNSGTGELTAPAELNSSSSGGDYLISWKGDGSTEYYVARCAYSTGDVREYKVYGTSVLLPSTLPDGKAADGAVITVTAYRGEELAVSDELELTFGKTLPYPQIRWELVTLGQYRVVLANQAEYEAFALENGIDLADISIKTNNPSATSTMDGAFEKDSKSIVFPASDGGKKVEDGNYYLYGSSIINNKVFTSYAEYNKKQGDVKDIRSSAKVMRESMYPTENNYNVKAGSGGFATIILEPSSSGKDEIGFSGKTIEELEYKISMAKTDEYVADFRSEIVADDPVLQVPVALTVSKQTKISTTTNKAIIVQLGNLPGDFLDKTTVTREDGTTEEVYRYQNVMVRAYPTKMSNDIVYQGWDVKPVNGDTLYSADELKTLSVDDSGRMDDEKGSLLIREDDSGKRTLKAGYVIERVGDDQYTVYFNALLKILLEGGSEGAEVFHGFDDLEAWRYNGAGSYMKYQIFYHKIALDSALGEKVQPEPVVYANAVYGADPADPNRSIWQNGIYDDDGSITLTWDQDAADGKPAYVNGEGKEPYAADATYILNLDGITKDINGVEKTTVLVNNLTISTNTDGKPYNSYSFDAATVKKWNFTELRGTLTRVGKVNGTHVTTMFPSTAKISLPMRRRLPQIQNVNISLQKENGVVMKDALDYVVTYHDLAAAGAIEAEIQALDYYLVTVQSKADAARKLETTSGTAKASVSLREVFDRNEQILITVKAVAKKDSAEYRDGSESAVLEMQVPNWLIPPQMGTPEDGTRDNMTELDHADARSVAEFQECSIKLHMEKENYATNVNYQIAIELYGSEAEAVKGENPLTEAGVYLPGREANPPVHMDYDSTSGYTYSLKGLPIQYAGHYIRVVLRAQGNGSISSVWTDQQREENMSPGEERVKEFMVFKLPDVQVDAVELTEGAAEPEIYPVFVNGQELVEDGKPVEVIAVQYSVQFETVAYADDYWITMIQSGQYADKKASPSDAEQIGYLVQDVNEMTLNKKSETEYELQFRSTEHDGQGKKIQATIPLELDGGKKALPYTEPVVVKERMEGDQVTAYAYVELKSYVELTSADDGTVRVSFVLPDCVEIQDTNAAGSASPLKENLNLTDQILVQSVAKQKQAGEGIPAQGSYRDSDWAFMGWDGSGFERNGNIRMDDAAHSVQEPTAGVSEGAPVTATANDNSTVTIHDVVYYLEDLKGFTRYVVSVSDSSGNEIGTYSVPYTENPVWGEMGQQVWFPVWDYTKYAEQTVKLKFRSVFPSVTGGISEWSDQIYEVYLPALPSWAETELTQNLSESRQYEVAVKRSTRAGRARQSTVVTKVLEAKQYQVTWDYDLGDLATAGYELSIHGENMDQDYRLKIDLTRSWFGSIPGLEEYLSEDGKVLYAVAYDLDGDILPYLTGAAIATASDSDVATASNADATPSDYGGQPGVLSLACRLKAEYTDEDDGAKIRFTLTLPDASFASLKGSLKEDYQNVFDDGLYQTEKILVSPIKADRRFPVPEAEWFYLEKQVSDGTDGKKAEEDSEDTELQNDLN